jgi:hypothetical protein
MAARAKRITATPVPTDPAAFETVEQFLARGGKIKRITIPPPSVECGIPVGYKAGLRRQGWAVL